VVGSLIEKQLTTPQQYPLTMNALLSACNQSSNRDPVVEFDERTVQEALVSLKATGLARFVHPSHGRSVVRYEQLLGESLGASERQLALVAVLLLRGPQTVGELRSRTERMCDFDAIADVDIELEALTKLAEPVVAKLSRRPGQKEERWVQLLTGSDGAPDGAMGASTSALGGPGTVQPIPGPSPVMAEPAGSRFEVAEGTGPNFGVAAPRSEVPEVAALRSEVAALRSEVAALNAQVVRLRDELEGMRRDLYD
jgi:uncharacterized protein YceH (UPF0502 family)